MIANNRRPKLDFRVEIDEQQPTKIRFTAHVGPWEDDGLLPPVTVVLRLENGSDEHTGPFPLESLVVVDNLGRGVAFQVDYNHPNNLPYWDLLPYEDCQRLKFELLLLACRYHRVSILRFATPRFDYKAPTRFVKLLLIPFFSQHFPKTYAQGCRCEARQTHDSGLVYYPTSPFQPK